MSVTECINMRDGLIRVAALRKENISKEMTIMLNELQNTTSQVFESTEIIMIDVYDNKNIGSGDAAVVAYKKWELELIHKYIGLVK